MKKLLFGLCALMMCAMATSCSDSKKDADDIMNLAEEILDNYDDWDLNEWENKLTEYAEASLEFWESNPSSDEIKKLNRIEDKLGKATKKNKVYKKALKNLKKDQDFKDLIKKIEKARKKAKEAAYKEEKENRDYDDDGYNSYDEDEDEDD